MQAGQSTKYISTGTLLALLCTTIFATQTRAQGGFIAPGATPPSAQSENKLDKNIGLVFWKYFGRKECAQTGYPALVSEPSISASVYDAKEPVRVEIVSKMELAQRARVYYKVLINGTTTAYTSGNDLWFITEARSQSDFEDRCALYSSPSQVAEKIAEFAKIREERAAKFKEMAEAQEKAVKLNIDQIEKEHLANLERIKLPSPAIGMTMHQVSERTFMGRPLRTSKTINATGTYETWYYENRRFMILFFHNGRLAQMSE